MANQQSPVSSSESLVLPEIEGAPVRQPPKTPDGAQRYRLVADDIRMIFARTSYPAIRRLQWECDGESLVLEGALSSYYLKQLVRSAVFKIAGIRSVVDRIEVCQATR